MLIVRRATKLGAIRVARAITLARHPDRIETVSVQQPDGSFVPQRRRSKPWSRLLALRDGTWGVVWDRERLRDIAGRTIDVEGVSVTVPLDATLDVPDADIDDTASEDVDP